MDSKNIFKRILYYMNPKHIEPKMVKLWAFWIVFWVVLFLVPTKMVTGSFWILVPLAGLFVYALVTKDVMQSLVLGTFSCYILWYRVPVLAALSMIYIPCLVTRKISRCICRFSFAAV